MKRNSKRNRTAINPTAAKLSADVVDHVKRNTLRNESETEWDGFEALRSYLSSSEDERAEELFDWMYEVPDAMREKILVAIAVLGDSQPQAAREAKRDFDEITELDAWSEPPRDISELSDDGVLRQIALDVLALDQGYATDQIPDEEKPSWFFLDMQRSVTSPSWIVHCTNADPYAVVNEFMGIDQIDKLGLTVHLDKSWFPLSKQGFGFAFEQDSFPRYGGQPCKYGRRQIAIKVPRYVLAWHFGDQEPQAIFWGPDVEQGFEFEYLRTLSGIEYYFPDPNLIASYNVDVPEPFERLEDMAAWIERQAPELREELFLKKPTRANPKVSRSNMSKLKRRLMR